MWHSDLEWGAGEPLVTGRDIEGTDVGACVDVEHAESAVRAGHGAAVGEDVGERLLRVGRGPGQRLALLWRIQAVGEAGGLPLHVGAVCQQLAPAATAPST